MAATKGKRRFWTEDEIEFLRKNRDLYTMPQMATKLGRTTQSVQAMLSKQGITITIPWTKEEIEILRKNYARVSASQLQKLLPGRSSRAIHSKVVKEELTVAKKWTEEEIQILKNNYNVIPIQELEALLPWRKRTAIYGKARQLNLHYEGLSGWIKTRPKVELEYLMRLKKINRRALTEGPSPKR